MDDLEQIDLVEPLRLQSLVPDQFANRTTFQRTDPVDSIEFSKHIDFGLRDHATVTHDDQTLEAEAFLQTLNLGQQSLGVADIAFMHRHGHRTPAHIAKQSVIDLQLALLEVPVVAVSGQRAGAAFKVTGSEVIEHQFGDFEMAACQFVLDSALAFQQPVHGRIQLVYAGIVNLELLDQGGVVPPSAGGEFGVGADDAGRDHGTHQVSFPTRFGADELDQFELFEGAADGLHGSVHSGADGLEGLIDFNVCFALQRAVDQFEGRFGEV